MFVCFVLAWQLRFDRVRALGHFIVIRQDGDNNNEDVWARAGQKRRILLRKTVMLSRKITLMSP